MGSTFSGLNIMTLGMAAQQLSQNTTGHNIANANTPGYSRQTVNLITTAPQQTNTAYGMSMVGTGVTAASITRARDFLVDTQYWQQNATQNYWSNQSDSLAKVENVFNDTKNTGIENAIEQFQTALATMASNPSADSTRTAAREAGNALVNTLQISGNELITQANNATGRIDAQIKQLNSYSTQIAALNKQIVTQEVGGAMANDLRDARDKLVDDLSALAQVNVTEEKSGAYTVRIAGSIPLVQGDQATTVTAVHERNVPYGYDTTTFSAVNGTISVNFKNGSLASLTDLRDTTIHGYLNQLDAMAQSLMQDFNAQHKNGLTGDMAKGDNFFGVTGTDYTNSAQYPTNQVPPCSWLSQLQVNPDFYGADGVRKIAAAGASAAGKADGTNATALANWLVSAPTTTSASLGMSSLSSYYSSIVSAVGVQSQQAQNMTTNQTAILNAVETTRDSLSGVNMNEELANTIKFQQAYGACAKMLTTMNAMFDTLLAMKQ